METVEITGKYSRGIEFKVDPKTAELLAAAGQAAERRVAAYHELMVRALFDPADQSATPLSPDALALRAELDEQSKYCPECGRLWEES